MSQDDCVYQIRFSDQALDSLLLAATEAYCLGDWVRPGDPVESMVTCGVSTATTSTMEAIS